MHIHTYVYTYTYVNIYAYTNIRIYMHMYTHILIYIYTYISVLGGRGIAICKILNFFDGQHTKTHEIIDPEKHITDLINLIC